LFGLVILYDLVDGGKIDVIEVIEVIAHIELQPAS